MWVNRLLWIHEHTRTHTATPSLVRWGDISSPITSSVWGVAVGEEGWVGSRRLVGFEGVAPPLSGAHWAPLARRPAAYHPKAAGSHKGPRRGRVEPGERHQHPQPNPPALYICAWLVSKSQTPFFPSKIPPPPHHAPPLFFSLTVILQQEKGRAFVVAHSVTQTQDLRLPVVKWKLSLGLSQCSLCSCRLRERGGNSYFSTWKGSRRGHEGWLFTLDTIDFESQRFPESSRECLLGCWHHVLIEFDCQQISKGPKQAYYENVLLGSCWSKPGKTFKRKGQMAFTHCRNHSGYFKLLHEHMGMNKLCYWILLLNSKNSQIYFLNRGPNTNTYV